jgi:hypothetical protein
MGVIGCAWEMAAQSPIEAAAIFADGVDVDPDIKKSVADY